LGKAIETLAAPRPAEATRPVRYRPACDVSAVLRHPASRREQHPDAVDLAGARSTARWCWSFV